MMSGFHWTLAVHRNPKARGWIVRYADARGVSEHYCRWYWQALREYNHKFRSARWPTA